MSGLNYVNENLNRAWNHCIIDHGQCAAVNPDTGEILVTDSVKHMFTHILPVHFHWDHGHRRSSDSEQVWFCADIHGNAYIYHFFQKRRLIFRGVLGGTQFDINVIRGGE